MFIQNEYVKTKTEMKDILTKAEKLDAIVIYSIVSKGVRSWIRPQMR